MYQMHLHMHTRSQTDNKQRWTKIHSIRLNERNPAWTSIARMKSIHLSSTFNWARSLSLAFHPTIENQSHAWYNLTIYLHFKLFLSLFLSLSFFLSCNRPAHPAQPSLPLLLSHPIHCLYVLIDGEHTLGHKSNQLVNWNWSLKCGNRYAHRFHYYYLYSSLLSASLCLLICFSPSPSLSIHSHSMLQPSQSLQPLQLIFSIILSPYFPSFILNCHLSHALHLKLVLTSCSIWITFSLLSHPPVLIIMNPMTHTLNESQPLFISSHAFVFNLILLDCQFMHPPATLSPPHETFPIPCVLCLALICSLSFSLSLSLLLSYSSAATCNYFLLKCSIRCNQSTGRMTHEN